ncbi:MULTISPECIES: helix-turn-helix transcriptional regulator [Campylobacter]|uniref:Transcriptional regulator n=1 Tax=Campylobacter aviculae TaxID=2510190 RepID=A0A4U7BL53_9BACT|nr:YafY family protein [Campylobacter aviculae]MBZ7964913.1 YafY family transcriptional regulator [Campylobacter sp. 2457A]TKX30870.1 transcriptional regulator [Campylobacter aviculae]
MKEHDKLAIRLAQILCKFNDGERLSIEELAQEFNVDARTIQRDLNERLSFMPIQKENGKYFLESFALGQLSFKDIQNFASLSGISELYPTLDQHFITDLLSQKINNVLVVKNEGFQKIDHNTFENIAAAILNHNILYFNYKEKKREVNPYKLVNYKGIWYLLADENHKLKHFNFSKIINLNISDKKFQPDENLKELINQGKNIWLEEKIEVILELDKNAKEYFFRKKVLSNYKIIDENEKSYILNAKISYDDEILNLVKQWIPYIKIISPIKLKTKLENILKAYLKK